MIKKLPFIFVILFSILFANKFIFLTNCDLLNYYPYISPDGFDWYLEGKQLFYPFYKSPAVLPVLRPPIFVFMTGLDGLVVCNLVLAILTAVNIVLFYIFCVKILRFYIKNIKITTNCFIAICATIAPINFIRVYILSDTLAVSFFLASIYFSLSFIKNGNKINLGLFFALLGGLTQTYALIPFLIILSYYFFKKLDLKLIKYLLFLLLIFLIITYYWRLILPHINTPDNFNLISINNNNFNFYLNNFLFFLSPLILLIIFHGINNFSIRLLFLDGLGLVLIVMTLLLYFYQWQESRFVFYIWPMVVIYCARFLNDSTFSSFYLVCYCFLMILYPLNYWNVKLFETGIGFSNVWVFKYFTSMPTDRGLNNCDYDCLMRSEIFIQSDSYMKSLLQLNVRLK